MNADVIIMGEGENTIIDLIDHINEKKRFKTCTWYLI